jgi:hypothetical protein
LKPDVGAININNFAQKIGATKKCGNNMKTPFLSSFAHLVSDLSSGFRQKSGS